MNNVFRGLENRWNQIMAWLGGLNPADVLPNWSVPMPSIDIRVLKAPAGEGGGASGTTVSHTPPHVASFTPAPMRRAKSAQRAAPTSVYDLRGSIVGGDVVRFVDERVASGARKMVEVG